MKEFIDKEFPPQYEIRTEPNLLICYSNLYCIEQASSLVIELLNDGMTLPDIQRRPLIEQSGQFLNELEKSERDLLILDDNHFYFQEYYLRYERMKSDAYRRIGFGANLITDPHLAEKFGKMYISNQFYPDMSSYEAFAVALPFVSSWNWS